MIVWFPAYLLSSQSNDPLRSLCEPLPRAFLAKQPNAHRIVCGQRPTITQCPRSCHRKMAVSTRRLRASRKGAHTAAPTV